MTGSRRREEIVSKIKSSEVPVPGKELAKVYDVSRQVIVTGHCADPCSRI